MIKNYHYIHRLRGNSYSFGLYDTVDKEDSGLGFEKDRLVGVIIYSVPASKQMCTGVCGPEFKDEVMELARLWIKDGTMANVESYFVSNSMKLIDKEIIISYADPDAKHRGIIYQATNFIYTGLSSGARDLIVTSLKSSHSRGTPKIGGYEALCEKYGKDNVIYVNRSKKHRYIYFNCSKGKRKFYMKRLKWGILPYPKQ